MVTLVRSDSVSEAWQAAVRAARNEQGKKLYHLVVSIADPLAEQTDVRKRVDELLKSCDLQAVDTVANTIMPAQLAQLCGGHAELVERYRALYERITSFPKNRWGTYFGRLVAYPVGHQRRPPPVDQLAPVIKALTSKRIIAAEYEMAVSVAGEFTEPAPVVSTDALIHHPTRGARGRGGPCLSYVAFQRQGDRVHATAHYRSQYLIERAYGNYIGLGRLLRYVAEETDLAVGELTVVTGYARIDQPLREIDRTFGDGSLGR